MGLEIINKLKKEQGLTNAELAQLSGVTVSTVDKITAGINTNPKLETLLALCRVLGCKLGDFDTSSEDISPVLSELLRDLKELDAHGLSTVRAVLAEELNRIRAQSQKNVIPFPTRKIKKFLTPVSAGPGSFLFDDGYEELDVPANTVGDFLVSVSGDSMEPYIRDGDTIPVSIGHPIKNGEVGIFYYDGSTYCKQFFEDDGYVYLISLNRARADKDLMIEKGLGLRLECYGKVVADFTAPLPEF